MIEKLEILLKKDNLTKEDLRDIANIFFAFEKQKDDLKKVNSKISNNPIRSYGNIDFRGNINEIKLNINLFTFLNDESNTIKKLFNLYNNIVHELEHAKSFEETKEENFYNYEQLMILLEYLGFVQSYNKERGKVKLNPISLILTRKITRLNYPISTSETNSRLVSYKKSLDLFLPYLNEEDIETYKNIIKSLEYINTSFEIIYNENKIPLNKFSTILKRALIVISKNKDIIQEFGILKNLFNEDGGLKNIYQLYKNINDTNKTMYDELIIHLFMNINVDLSEYFNDSEFKSYIEELVSKYNKKVVFYFMNKNLGEPFISSKRMYVDNAKMLKQNVLLLNQLKEYYNLDINSGIALDYSLRKDFKINAKSN